MKLQKIQTIYFSPTGGTKCAALLLAKSLQGTLADLTAEELDITDTQTAAQPPLRISPDTICIFAVPVFGGRVPEAALSRIRQIQGSNTPCILMAVYGNRDFEDALLELFDTVSDCGFLPLAAISAIAEHSLMRRFAKGRPDAEDKARFSDFGKAIAEKLCNASSAALTSLASSKDGETAQSEDALRKVLCLSEEQLPGKRPYKEFNGVPMHPKANRRCTNCGVCALHCPVNAIPKDAPSKTDATRCISCMRCASVCPAHARKLNPLMRFTAEHKMQKLFKKRREAELIL